MKYFFFVNNSQKIQKRACQRSQLIMQFVTFELLSFLLEFKLKRFLFIYLSFKNSFSCFRETDFFFNDFVTKYFQWKKKTGNF